MGLFSGSRCCSIELCAAKLDACQEEQIYQWGNGVVSSCPHLMVGDQYVDVILAAFLSLPALPSDPEQASSEVTAGIGLHCSTCDSLLKTRTNLNTNRLEDLKKTLGGGGGGTTTHNNNNKKPTKPSHISVPVHILKPLGGRWGMRIFFI